MGSRKRSVPPSTWTESGRTPVLTESSSSPQRGVHGVPRPKRRRQPADDLEREDQPVAEPAERFPACRNSTTRGRSVRQARPRDSRITMWRLWRASGEAPDRRRSRPLQKRLRMHGRPNSNDSTLVQSSREPVSGAATAVATLEDAAIPTELMGDSHVDSAGSCRLGRRGHGDAGGQLRWRSRGE